ncbi:MAG: hypothetical protein Q7S02_01585 [bacterium]|nr:hypothetical protein [bacterium]
MAEDLRKQLGDFQTFFRDVEADLDRLSKEQQDLLRSILQRIEQEQIAAIRAELAKPSS